MGLSYGFNDAASASDAVVAIPPTPGDTERARVRGVIRGGAPAVQTRRPALVANEAQFLQPFSTEIERCRSYLYPYHRLWYSNIAAYMGSSSAGVEAIARLARARGVAAPTPDHRIHHRSNLIGGNVRRVLGYLSRSNSDPEVVPADVDDPWQVDAAKGARSYLDWLIVYDEYKRKEQDLLLWVLNCGFAVAEALWDPFGGPVESAIDDDSGDVLAFPDGRPMVDSKKRPRRFSNGIPLTHVHPSFHYVYNISARTQDEVSWNGLHCWMSFRELEHMMPGVVKDFGLVPQPQFSTAESIYERQVMMTMGAGAPSPGVAPDSGEPGCVVTKLYVAPRFMPREVFGDEVYEQGAVLMVSQGRLLPINGVGRLTPNPFLEIAGVNPRRDWNPMTICTCYDVPGRLLGQGVVENQAPVVDARNDVISRIRETHRMTGQPKVLVPKGTTQQRINNEAGQIIQFNPAIGPPAYMLAAPMPGYIFQTLQLLDMDVEQIASQPPMMQGKAQGQIRSAMGVQLLQEQALTEFTPLLGRVEQFRARHWRQLLLREIQYGDNVRRMVAKTGSGDWKMQSFFGKKLNPDFTLRITPGSSMPTSKALVMSELDRLIAWGVLQPAMIPQHAQIIARAMQLEVPQYTADDQEQAINRARYENEILRSRPGEMPQPLASENHVVHGNEHMRDLHSPRTMALVDAERKALGYSPTLGRFYQHIGLHQGMQQAQAMGALLPQPQMPLEELQFEMQSQGSAMNGSPGGPKPITSQVGGQNMTNRGMPPQQFPSQPPPSGAPAGAAGPEAGPGGGPMMEAGNGR